MSDSDLEKAVEDLSQLLEEPVEAESVKSLRQRMLDKTVCVQSVSRTDAHSSRIIGLRSWSSRDRVTGHRGQAGAEPLGVERVVRIGELAHGNLNIERDEELACHNSMQAMMLVHTIPPTIAFVVLPQQLNILTYDLV